MSNISASSSFQYFNIVGSRTVRLELSAAVALGIEKHWTSLALLWAWSPELCTDSHAALLTRLLLADSSFAMQVGAVAEIVT